VPLFALLFYELILSQAAQGANPILRDVLKLGARGNAVIRIAQGGIVPVAAGFANVYHKNASFAKIYCIIICPGRRFFIPIQKYSPAAP